MGFFNIFKKNKKKKKELSIKELCSPVLGEMWVCTFNFCPWDEEDNDVCIKKVKIVSARADSKGIFVESSSPYPFGASSVKNVMQGYIDRISSGWYWTGFFETRAKAVKAYDELMEKWISAIRGNMEKVEKVENVENVEKMTDNQKWNNK